MKKCYRIILSLIILSLFTACKHSADTPSFYQGQATLLQLEGIVLNVPTNSELELALFALDKQNKPIQLLAVESYQGNGNALTFNMAFQPHQTTNKSAIHAIIHAIELRGRVTQAGRLVGHLAPWYKQQLTDQDLKGIILELTP